MKTTLNKKSGFTLVELAIVLVIIGLIVGGVLAGQDLIKAAQVRSAVGQFEKYDTAVNTFRGKYNGVPGDVGNCVNFFAAASCATTGTTAGNSILEDVSGTRVLLSGEPNAFWKQLYDAALISEPITATTAINANAAVVAGAVVNTFPAAKIGNGNSLIAYTVSTATTGYAGFSGSNAYRMIGITSTAATGVPTFANALTPLEAFQIDTKKDDGVPNSGIVMGADNIAAFNIAGDTPAPGAATCMATATTFNTGPTNGVANNRLCNLLIKASF
jgi:prepilin-type N-terminal cleavage/methylation domain-containing protein